MLFIQKLLKHSQSWIFFFPAAAGPEIEIFTATGAKSLTVLPAEKLALHVQHEVRHKDLVEIDLRALQQKELGILAVVLFDDRRVQRRLLRPGDRRTAAVADAIQLRRQRALQTEDARLVVDPALVR